MWSGFTPLLIPAIIALLYMFVKIYWVALAAKVPFMEARPASAFFLSCALNFPACSWTV